MCKIQTHRGFTITLLNTTKHNMPTLGVIHFIKLHNDTSTSIKGFGSCSTTLAVIVVSDFCRFSVYEVEVSLCSLIKWTTPKIGMLCFVVFNSVIVNPLCVWILHTNAPPKAFNNRRRILTLFYSVTHCFTQSHTHTHTHTRNPLDGGTSWPWPCCFTSTEERLLIRDGGEGGGGRESEGSTAVPPEKDRRDD